MEYQGEVLGRERDPAFVDTILTAKQMIENYAEDKLYDKDYPTKGVIFSLSNNNRGWAEKIETKVETMKDPAEELADGLMDGAAAKADTPANDTSARAEPTTTPSPTGERGLPLDPDIFRKVPAAARWRSISLLRTT